MLPKVPELEPQVSLRLRAYLQEAIDTRGLTLIEVAQRLGMNDGNLNRKLKGGRLKFSAAQVLKIAELCQVNPLHLLYRNPPTQYFKGEKPPPEIDL